LKIMRVLPALKWFNENKYIDKRHFRKTNAALPKPPKPPPPSPSKSPNHFLFRSPNL
jgi:hypothetical protein